VHREMLAISRQAGMAEVASGVLHNVGNVLNSVNVSANLLIERVKGSKIDGLAKVTVLLRDHGANLPAFLTTDPRGMQIPKYLELLSGSLAAEQRAAVEELGALRRNLEHINEIVAMQQNYATISGVTEHVVASAVIEDAIRVAFPVKDGGNIELRREFLADPMLSIDRHKLLQIVMNLLQNAKRACLDADPAVPKIVVRMTQIGQRVRIEVVDNGVGIPPENLERLFSFGFTTRKSGHGFGLHHSALSAKELDGTLTGASEGPGRGATFTLELPIVSEPSVKKSIVNPFRLEAAVCQAPSGLPTEHDPFVEVELGR
jgi:signal transduction histidine kinase